MARSVKPQLAQTTTDPFKYINDDKWAISQKIDGQRLIAIVSNGKVEGMNRNGDQRDVPRRITETLAVMPGEWVFDGELLGNEYWVFDLLQAPEMDLLDQPWMMRVRCLDTLFQLNPLPYLQPVAWHTSNKAAFYDQCCTNESEGVMFKHIESTYQGLRRSTWQKFKFLHTVDCEVTELGRGDKDNLVLAVYRDGEPIEVGKVSALTGDGPKVKVGDVVEVTVAYATKNGRLFHPKLPYIRTDKLATDCLWDQIEACQTNKAVQQ